LLCLTLLALATPAASQDVKPAEAIAPKSFEHSQIEIYRIAPGQQEAFLRFSAKCDEANRLAGVPPRQLYVHQDGADWDFLVIQPSELPPEKSAALAKAWKEVGLPSGANFFFEIRKFIAVHTDTATTGPTTAADYLASMKK
jgi:hypothetical protein